MSKLSYLRDDARMSKEEFYEQTKIVLTKEELAHFNFGSTDKISFLDQLRPVIRRYAKNGFRKPSDVSRLLNKAGVTTACGARWTPRLAWFLLRFLFQEEEGRPTAKSAAANPKRTSLEARDATDQLAAPARKVRKESYPKTPRASSKGELPEFRLGFRRLGLTVVHCGH